MAQNLTVKALGLKTYPNQISECPPGSLFQADNLVIDREGVLEPRRGYNQLPGPLGTDLTFRANQIFRFQNNVLAHYGPPGAPTTISFYSPEVIVNGIQTLGSNVITNLISITNLYAGEFITVETIEQDFTGTMTLGTSTITNVFSTMGLYVGQSVGGIGIAVGATITSITGSGPFTVGISSPATFQKVNAAFVASNANILGFPDGTTITAVGSNSITVSNNATVGDRTITFLPAAVDVVGDDINIAINGLVNSQIVMFTSTGTLPGGLTAGTPYFVINATDSNFQLSLGSGSSAVDITSQGTGVHTLTALSYIESYGFLDFTGTYLQPDSTTKLRSVESNSNVYFTTSSGVQKLDSLTSTIVPSGAPKGLDGFATLDIADSGFLPTDTQVAYRVVWGYQDLNKNLILGAPGQRILVANISGSSKNVDLNITIPDGVGTNYFYQVYRSGFSADANSEPNDEMALVYETNPTASDLTNGFVTFTDETPESLRNGAALYTSPSQEGILQANSQPPFSKDMTLFKGSVFYANTRTKQNLTLSILAISGQFSINGDITSVSGDTPTTVQNIGISVTGDLTATSNTMNNVSDVSSLYVGQTISDVTNPSYLPTGTTITQIVNANTITLSDPASNTSTGDTFSVQIAGLVVGQQVTGSGIPPGTTVSQVYLPSTATGNVTSGSPVVTGILSTAGAAIGQVVTGPDLPSSTTIVSIDSSTQVTLSKNATATVTGEALTLEYGFQISNPATSTGTVVITLKNGSGGIQLGDTFTLAGITYTASAVENVAAKQFQLFSQGSPSQNIADTAQSLIRVINRTTGPESPVDAVYLSGFQELPGKIFFEERIFSDTTFYATAGNSAQGMAYSPNLPGPGGTKVGSINDQFSNGLYYSKTQEPEAVPLLNFIQVGSAYANILRVIALRDSLFILKEDGIFRLTGQDPTSFVVDLFDSTTIIISAESAVSLNNLIFMFSKYGIVTVSDTGVTVVSRPIEDQMLDILEASTAGARNLSFGISYESDRKYIFFSITNPADTFATQAYVYNTFTESWTRWVLSQTCGIIHPTQDVQYLGNAGLNTFDIERKKRDFTDYTDSSFPVTLIGLTGTTTTGSPIITSIPDTTFFNVGQQIGGIGIPANTQIISIDPNSITLNANSTSSGVTTLQPDEGKTLVIDTLENLDVAVGDILYQTDGRYSIITSVNAINGTITVRDYIDNWVLGDSFIYKAITSTATYAPQTAGNPGELKQFREAALLMQVPSFNIINMGFSTDLSSGVENVPLNGLYRTPWGRFAWGMLPWGSVTKAEPIRTYVPQQKQRCSLLNITLTHNEAYSYYRLNGISFIHNDMSERVGK